MTLRFIIFSVWAVAALRARTGRPLQAQSQSTLDYGTAADGSQTVEIRNVTYEVTGTGVPGRTPSERLLLRKTIHSKGALDDIGVDATVTLEAWPLGTDLKQKPIYTLTQTGTAGQTIYPDLFVVDRQLEEVQWWSVHKLGNGQHLFDTYVPLLSFSITRDTVTTRYVGLDVPPDDVKDPRLKEPHVIAVFIYASGDRVIREALLTCDDPKQAQLLRSYFDSTRTLTDIDAAPRHTLKLSIRQNYPSPPGTIEVQVPIVGDGLDVAHAVLPPHLHLSSWKR